MKLSHQLEAKLQGMSGMSARFIDGGAKLYVQAPETEPSSP
jgi:hypothetical protein